MDATRNTQRVQEHASTPACVECGRERTDDDIDYSPAQAIFGVRLGWYSGSDGEMCGQCMAKIARGDF